MKKLFLFLLSLPLLANIYSNGGSNFSMISLGQYPTLARPNIGDNHDLWYGGEHLRPTIPYYHQLKSQADTQLQAMYDNNQQKIILTIWYIYKNREMPNSVYGHTLQINDSNLVPQHQTNLKDIILKIKEIGFNQLIIRFAAQGNAQSREWDKWYEDRFQKNWNFINNTKKFVDGFKGDLPVFYDLEIEAGGITKNQAEQYNKKLLQNFISKHGQNETIGYSIATSRGRVSRLLTMYTQVGFTPKILALDIYNNFKQLFEVAVDEMKSSAFNDLPIIIMETFYNNTPIRGHIDQVVNNKNVKVASIYQWQKKEGLPSPHFSEQSTPLFDAYSSRPILISLQLEQSSLILKGKNLTKKRGRIFIGTREIRNQYTVEIQNLTESLVGEQTIFANIPANILQVISSAGFFVSIEQANLGVSNQISIRTNQQATPPPPQEREQRPVMQRPEFPQRHPCERLPMGPRRDRCFRQGIQVR